jgi:hypothetical protein
MEQNFIAEIGRECRFHRTFPTLYLFAMLFILIVSLLSYLKKSTLFLLYLEIFLCQLRIDQSQIQFAISLLHARKTV